MAEPLPPNWNRYQTAEGKEYFHNTITNVTQWERPAPEPVAASGMMDEVYQYKPAANDMEASQNRTERVVEMQGLLDSAAAQTGGAVQLGASQKEVPTSMSSSSVPSATNNNTGSSGGMGGLGTIVGSALAAGAMSAITGSTSNNNNSNDNGGGLSGWLLSSAQQLFDVSTDDVVKRLRLVLMPYPPPAPGAGVAEELKARPDFYGPFWVATTAVLFLAATGNFAQLVEAGTHAGFKPNYNLVTIAASMIYGCLLAVPVVVRISVFASGEEAANVDVRQLICVCGYALAPAIPISILCIVPLDSVRWFLTLLGLGASLFFLKGQLYADFASKVTWLKWVLIASPCAAQVIIYAVYRMHFFSRSAVKH